MYNKENLTRFLNGKWFKRKKKKKKNILSLAQLTLLRVYLVISRQSFLMYSKHDNNTDCNTAALSKLKKDAIDTFVYLTYSTT